MKQIAAKGSHKGDVKGGDKEVKRSSDGVATNVDIEAADAREWSIEDVFSSIELSGDKGGDDDKGGDKNKAEGQIVVRKAPEESETANVDKKRVLQPQSWVQVASEDVPATRAGQCGVVESVDEAAGTAKVFFTKLHITVPMQLKVLESRLSSK